MADETTSTPESPDARPDSASPDSASPDSASPDSASPDSASPDSASPDSASTDYKRAGFNQRLGMGDAPAVVMVDMCKAYFEPDSPLFTDRPEVVDACKTLVAAARASDIPVLWTRVELEPGGANGGVFRRKAPVLHVFETGNGPFGDWVDGLAPEDDDVVITKQYASGFFNTSLAEDLRALEVDTTIIGGVSTSGCVRATALDACQSGFAPIVVAEACGDRNQAVHDANLFDLDNKYADVESLETVLALIQ